jgi:hypothetical protein
VKIPGSGVKIGGGGVKIGRSRVKLGRLADQETGAGAGAALLLRRERLVAAAR